MSRPRSPTCSSTRCVVEHASSDLAGRATRGPGALAWRIYLLSTIALIILSVGGVAAGQLLDDFFEDDPLRLELSPDAASLEQPLRQVAQGFDQEVEIVALPNGEDPGTALERDELDAVVTQPETVVFGSEVDSAVMTLIGRAAYETALPARSGALGLTLEQARSLTEPVPVRPDVLGAPTDEGRLEDFGGIASLATMVLLFAISFYGNWVLVGVIEEKANRVVEVLLATMAPWQLLTGKVLGTWRWLWGRSCWLPVHC